MASVGLADPAIYKNKPILNRLIEHYNVSVLTLVTEQELQMCTNVLFVNRIEAVKAVARAPLPSAVIWTWGEAQQWSSRSMSSVPLVAPNYYTSNSLPANCSSGTAGCGSCHILRHVRNVMMGQIVLRSAHRGRVQSSTGDLILHCESFDSLSRLLTLKGVMTWEIRNFPWAFDI